MVITTEYTFILKRFDDCLSKISQYCIYIYKNIFTLNVDKKNKIN